MSNYESMSEEQVAQVDRQLDEVHRFLLSLFDDPSPLEKIPTGSILWHRTIQLDGRRIQLTAHRLSESDDLWTALVTDWDSPAALPPGEYAYDVNSNSESIPKTRPIAESDQLLIQKADTADAALDALEQLILKQQTAVANA